MLSDCLREGYTTLREMGLLDPPDFFARLRGLRDLTQTERKRRAMDLAANLDQAGRADLARKLRRACNGLHDAPPVSNRSLLEDMRSSTGTEARWFSLRTREDFLAWGLLPTFYRLG